MHSPTCAHSAYRMFHCAAAAARKDSTANARLYGAVFMQQCGMSQSSSSKRMCTSMLHMRSQGSVRVLAPVNRIETLLNSGLIRSCKPLQRVPTYARPFHCHVTTRAHQRRRAAARTHGSVPPHYVVMKASSVRICREFCSVPLCAERM